MNMSISLKKQLYFILLMLLAPFTCIAGVDDQYGKRIGKYAFLGVGVSEVTIPQNVEKICEGAFGACSFTTLYFNVRNCVMLLQVCLLRIWMNRPIYTRL